MYPPCRCNKNQPWPRSHSATVRGLARLVSGRAVGTSGRYSSVFTQRGERLCLPISLCRPFGAAASVRSHRKEVSMAASPRPQIEVAPKESAMARFGLALSNWSERWFPDPLVFALLGIVVVFVFGLLLHESPSNLAIQGGKNFWALVPL